MQASVSVKYSSQLSSAVFSPEGFLYTIDRRGNIKVFSQNGEIKEHYKLSLHEDEYGVVAGISADAKYLMGVGSGKKIAIWSLQTKEIVNTLEQQQGEIVSISCDQRGSVFSASTLDGRVYQCDTKSCSLAFSMSSGSQAAVPIAFSASNSWMAGAGADGFINLVNISASHKTFRLLSPGRNCQKLLFSGDDELIVYDARRALSKLSTQTTKFEVSSIRLDGEYVDMKVFDGKKMLLAVGVQGQCSVIGTKDFAILAQSDMGVTGRVLFVVFHKALKNMAVFTDDKLYIFDLEQQRQYFSKTVKDKLYEEAYEVIANNAWLHLFGAVSVLDEAYEQNVALAMQHLEKGEINEAKATLEAFVKTPKGALAKEMIRSFEQFDNFVQLSRSRRFAQAYQLSENYKLFRQSIYFKAMEEEWAKTFKEARALLDANKDEEAKELLAQFRGVSEKTELISEMVAKKNILNLFTKKLGSRDFRSFFELANLYPFLKELDEYKQAGAMGIGALRSVKVALFEGDMGRAIKYMEILKYFPMLKAQTDALEQRINIYSKFFSNIKADNFDNALALAKMYKFLEETKVYKELDSKWRLILKKATEHASAGKVAECKKTFGQFLEFKSKQQTIAQTILEGYIVQLYGRVEECVKRGVRPTDFPQFEGSLANLIGVFGRQEIITAFLKDANKQMNRPFSTGGAKEGNIAQVIPKDLPNDI